MMPSLALISSHSTQVSSVTLYSYATSIYYPVDYHPVSCGFCPITVMTIDISIDAYWYCYYSCDTIITHFQRQSSHGVESSAATGNSSSLSHHVQLYSLVPLVARVYPLTTYCRTTKMRRLILSYQGKHLLMMLMRGRNQKQSSPMMEASKFYTMCRHCHGGFIGCFVGDDVFICCAFNCCC